MGTRSIPAKAECVPGPSLRTSWWAKFPPTVYTQPRAAPPPPSAGGIAVAQLPLLDLGVVFWPGRDFQIGGNPLGSERSLLPAPSSREGAGDVPCTDVPRRQVRSVEYLTSVCNLGVKPVTCPGN